MTRLRWCRKARVIAALLALAMATASGVGTAEDVPVPVELQAMLLAKVASYDRNLSARAGERVRILLVGKPRDPMSMPFIRQMRHALAAVDGFGSLPHEEEVVEFTNIGHLVDKCRAGRISIVYFGPGFGRDVEMIRVSFESISVLTVTAMPEEVERGIVLGFDLVSGKPKLLVHLTQARKQRVDLMADVLKLMQVFE